MAIFHFNESNISRSDGRSAIACAAYRACEKLEDLNFGKTQDYRRKKGLIYKKIYAPLQTDISLLNRQDLWNSVEKKEFNANGSMKANARLAKEYICALPHEITDDERIIIVDEFCRNFAHKYNVIVDACIHAPHENNDGKDNKNYHVHIMFTTRTINENGHLDKKQRIFNDFGPDVLRESRENFAKGINRALERAGFDKESYVDHRSYKDRGLDFLEPTIHEGYKVTALRRKGISTEISLKNDSIKTKNLAAIEAFKGLQQEIIISDPLKDKISELESELNNTQMLEEKLLVELQEIDHQQKQFRTQQVCRVERAYDDFVKCQDIYVEFKSFYKDLYKKGATQTNEINKKLTRTRAWLKEHERDFHVNSKDGCFYDSYHYTYRDDVRKPDFYMTEKQKKIEQHEIWRSFASQVEDLANKYNIYSNVKRLKECAEILTANNIELPVIKKTFWQKLKGEHVDSFNTLSDFEEQIIPLLKEKKLDDEKLELKRIRDEQQSEVERRKKHADEEWHRQFQKKQEAKKLENEKRLALEYEERRRLLIRQQLEMNSTNDLKKPNKDIDNDPGFSL